MGWGLSWLCGFWERVMGFVGAKVYMLWGGVRDWGVFFFFLKKMGVLCVDVICLM